MTLKKPCHVIVINSIVINSRLENTQEPHAKPESKDKAGFLSSGTRNTLIYTLQKKYISFCDCVDDFVWLLIDGFCVTKMGQKDFVCFQYISEQHTNKSVYFQAFLQYIVRVLL